MDMEFNMSKPEISIIDASTGVQVVREMTTAEYNEYKNFIKQNADKLAADEIEAKAKATAKAALLSKLGITAEEAVLLLS